MLYSFYYPPFFFLLSSIFLIYLFIYFSVFILFSSYLYLGKTFPPFLNQWRTIFFLSSFILWIYIFSIISLFVILWCFYGKFYENINFYASISYIRSCIAYPHILKIHTYRLYVRWYYIIKSENKQKIFSFLIEYCTFSSSSSFSSYRQASSQAIFRSTRITKHTLQKHSLVWGRCDDPYK